MSNKINADDFKLIKEDKKDFKNSRLERGNLKSEFTIAQLESDYTLLERGEREAKAQIKVSEAVVANVERNHPFVSKLSDEQLSVASYLFEAKQALRKAEKQVGGIKVDKKNYNNLLKVVYDKFGFVPTSLTSITKENEPSK
jgi:hypothetical protein